MANLGGDFFGELGGIAAKVASNQPITAAFVRKAAITVSQGQDDQGFHMLVNMNGREYVLRGDEAENFRKEYAAIPKPPAQVNALVEKYMNALKPYAAKAKEEPLWPEYVGRVEQAENEHARQDEENYWAGKGAPGYRYSSMDMVADIVQHDKENRGQFREFEPLTGSSDGEFSDIGGVKPLKVTAAELQEGDEARGHLPSGAEFAGTIESINGDDVVIKSTRGPKRTFKMKDVISGEEYDLKVQHNIQQSREQQAQEAEAEKGRKRDERIEKSVSVTDPTGSAGQMVPELQRRGYSLTLKYKADQYLEQAEKEWEEWTGGEQLGEECVKQYDTMYGREWTLVYADPERSMPVFFKIDPMGTHEGKRSPEPIGLSQRDRVVVNYPEIVGELVKAGLRMNCGSSTQELRASMADTKKACGDNCAEVDEEVTLPAAIEVEGQGGKSLPPAETAVETDKEAGFNFFFPGQVVKEFYPELQHEIVDYPNDNNAPMIEDIDLDSALDVPVIGHVSSISKEGYASTSPAGGVGIGRDGKPQVLDGAPLRNENDIRGGMFMDEFHQQYDGVPGAMLAVASWKPKKTAGNEDEKAMFNKFMKLVMGEIAATMVAAFKVTGRPLALNKVPGVGEVQLAQVEQPNSLSSFNIVNTGSRVKYLLEKLNDGDVKEAINGARAQAAVWLDDPNGGFVYEVFARAESIDTDSMIMKYTFVTGSKESV